MSIWVLSDLHLALNTPSKDMKVFGPSWDSYAEKISKNWHALVDANDLVLIPGDISWASTLEEAKTDLEWIHSLPGTKLLIKGNHDYWWGSNAKMTKHLPPSLHFLHNTSFLWNGVSFAGTRLWDTTEYNFSPYIAFQENPRARKDIIPPTQEETEKIFQKELERLETSLSCMAKEATLRIALTHYPPIGADLAPSKTSALLEAYKIDICVFGHLHNVRKEALPFGTARGVQYVFASADYIDFIPQKLR